MGSKPLLLVVLEGATAGEPPGALAALPHATASLDAAGAAVGLVDGEPGDAESGWATLGAGRPIPPAIVAIEREAASGRLALRERLQLLFRAVHNLSGPAPTNLLGFDTGFEEDRRSSLHVFLLLTDAKTRPSRAVRRAIFAAAESDGVRLRVHAVFDHGLSYSAAGRHLEHLSADLPEHGTIASLSGRRYGFDAHDDAGRAIKLFDAVVRGEAPPRLDEWIDVLGEAHQGGTRPEDIAPVRLGRYAGMRGSFFADFSSATREWAWHAEDVALVLGSRPSDFSSLVRLLLNEGLAEHAAKHLVERGKRVRALDRTTLVSLLPTEPLSAAGPLEALVAAQPERAASLLHDLARLGRVLAVAPVSRRHGLTFLGGGSVPTGVELRLEDTDREEPELSVRALVAPARAALASGAHDVVLVSVPELDRAAHTGDELAVVAAERAVGRSLGPLVTDALQRGGRACVVSPYASSVDGAIASHRGHTTAPVPLWLFGEGAALEPTGALADVAPTLAAWLGLPALEGATGRSLLR